MTTTPSTQPSATEPTPRRQRRPGSRRDGSSLSATGAGEDLTAARVLAARVPRVVRVAVGSTGAAPA